MAQARVSDFFAAKKRSHNSHASKRRKLDLTVSDSQLDQVTSSELHAASVENAMVKQAEQVSMDATEKKGPAMQGMKVQQTRSTRTTRSRAASRRKSGVLEGQLKIKDVFAQSSGSSSDSDSQASNGHDDVTEEVTSCWDEHDGPKTPRKRIRPFESLELPETTIARPTRRKLVVKKRITEAVTPQSEREDGDSAQLQKQKLAASARKKLSMAEVEVHSEKITDVTPTDGIQWTATDCPPNMKDVHLPSVVEIHQEFAPSATVPHSPLPPTPDMGLVSPVKKSKTVSVTSPKLKASIEKCKFLSEGHVLSRLENKAAAAKKDKVLAPEVIRERLAKCGKLEALKSKLAEMNSTLRVVRKIEEDKKKAADVPESESARSSCVRKDVVAVAPETKSKTEAKPSPAYERYEYLAKEGVPTLCLPGKFQCLLTMFQGTDTVVSMLYNRQETITFTKLRNAVQSMTRKNFEQKTLGQIKTVYPTSYTLRQEKNLPCFGNKTSGYQLTVQPDLADCTSDGCTVNEDGRATFTASALLKRKRIFHGNLLDIVKNHHADFLSKLSPPVQVPTYKLTRWHPRFPLDSLPDISAASLPAPPVKAYETARQVLENSKGKVPDKVEAALRNVATSSAASKPDAELPNQASNPKPVTSAHRGIPLSLLEKIRAKEAAKIQAALTRDPAEDRKTDMMGRLPALIRSLRTHYVTEKKPTLPLGLVVQKLADSYATCISNADVEAHLKLLQELAPKWIQVVEIARGKFVKIDKNADISEISNKITNLAKSRK